VLRVVGGDVGDVLVGQAGGDAAHRRVLALALLVAAARFDVLGGLAADLRHLEHFREGGLVAGMPWQPIHISILFGAALGLPTMSAAATLSSTGEHEKCEEFFHGG
jgi:hypothetical protein